MQGIRDLIVSSIIVLGFLAFLLWLMVVWHPPFGPTAAVTFASIWAVLGFLVGREERGSLWRRLRRSAIAIAVITALVLVFGLYVQVLGNGYGTDYDDLDEVGRTFLGHVIIAVVGFASGFGLGGDRGPDEGQD